MTSFFEKLVAEPGANRVEYQDTGVTDRRLCLWSARPRQWSPACPVLIALHGAARNGSDYRDHWLPLVDDANVLVVAPEFSQEEFPGKQFYEFGGVIGEEGRLQDRAKTTFAIIDRLFGGLWRSGVTLCDYFGLFGHSAGGQVVHRSLSLGYGTGAVVAITANAGIYSMPDLDTAYPYGLGGLGRTDDDLRRLLSLRVTTMIGTNDTETDSPAFPSEEAAMRQGANRFLRARTYLATARAAAERLDANCLWTSVDVPGVGHQGDRMAEAAAPIVSAALHAPVMLKRAAA